MLRKIDEAYQKALSGSVLDKQEIIDLLSVPVGSDECAYLCRKANEAAHVLTHDTAYLWGAIGLDYAPCPKSCDFCSFGAAWHLIKEPKVFALPEILDQVREYVRCGVHFIVLRTTQYYPLERLCEYVRTIRQEVEGSYELILITHHRRITLMNRLSNASLRSICQDAFPAVSSLGSVQNKILFRCALTTSRFSCVFCRISKTHRYFRKLWWKTLA